MAIPEQNTPEQNEPQLLGGVGEAVHRIGELEHTWEFTQSEQQRGTVQKT